METLWAMRNTVCSRQGYTTWLVQVRDKDSSNIGQSMKKYVQGETNVDVFQHLHYQKANIASIIRAWIRLSEDSYASNERTSNLNLASETLMFGPKINTINIYI